LKSGFVRLKVRCIVRRRQRPLPEGGPSKRPQPGLRVLDGTRVVTLGKRCEASGLELCEKPVSRREFGVSPRGFERNGRGASSTLLRSAKPGAAGGCSGRSGFGASSRGASRASVVVRSDGGRCPSCRHEAPEVGVAGRAFSADGADGPHARGACRHALARLGKTWPAALRTETGRR
jgi:hypothetical protein